MIAGRALVKRIRNSVIPKDLAPFDLGLASLCLDLSDAAYALMPDFEVLDEAGEIEFHDQFTAQDLKEIRTLVAADPGSGGGQAEGRVVFIYDGLFIKALGYRVSNLLVVAIRGTAGIADMITDARASTTRLAVISPLTGVQAIWRAHNGFLKLTMEIKEPVERELARVCRDGDRLVVTGHSLGGAVGLLFGAMFDHSGISRSGRSHLPPQLISSLSSLRTAALYSFGSPRPGRDVSGVGFPHHRIVADGDWIVRLSPFHRHDVSSIKISEKGLTGSTPRLPWNRRIDPLRNHRISHYRDLMDTVSSMGLPARRP